MARQRLYNNAAERQRAYRQRSRQNALRLSHVETRGAGKESLCGLPVGCGWAQGVVLAHREATGLLLRFEEVLDGGRVLATVIAAGVSRLCPGRRYPFRLDLLCEVER